MLYTYGALLTSPKDDSKNRFLAGQSNQCVTGTGDVTTNTQVGLITRTRSGPLTPLPVNIDECCLAWLGLAYNQALLYHAAIHQVKLHTVSTCCVAVTLSILSQTIRIILICYRLVIICPIAIAYGMGQIRLYKIGLRLSVCQCICPSASTLTVAFLDRFLPKLAQT